MDTHAVSGSFETSRRGRSPLCERGPAAAAEHVREFISRTGFPDLPLVSHKILDAARTAITEVAAELELDIVHAAIDGACSVAKSCALPYSDLDHFEVIVRDTRRIEPTGPLRRLFGARGADPVEIENAKAETFSRLVKLRLAATDLVEGVDELKVMGVRTCERTIHEMDMHRDFIPGEATELARIFECRGNALRLVPGDDAWFARRSACSPWLSSIQSECAREMSVQLPAKFKHAARASLVAAFPELRVDEQLAVIEILGSSVTEGKVPAVLTDTEWRVPIESLLRRGLLVELSPGSAEFERAARVLSTYGDWHTRLYVESFRERKLVAPWKMSWPDELLLSEQHEAGALERFLGALPPDARTVPPHVKALLTQFHDPVTRAKTDRWIARQREKHGSAGPVASE